MTKSLSANGRGLILGGGIKGNQGHSRELRRHKVLTLATCCAPVSTSANCTRLYYAHLFSLLFHRSCNTSRNHSLSKRRWGKPRVSAVMILGSWQKSDFFGAYSVIRAKGIRESKSSPASELVNQGRRGGERKGRLRNGFGTFGTPGITAEALSL